MTDPAASQATTQGGLAERQKEAGVAVESPAGNYYVNTHSNGWYNMHYFPLSMQGEERLEASKFLDVVFLLREDVEVTGHL
jgi:hypothetical protein